MCNPFNLQFFSYERIALIKLIEKEMIILISGKIEPFFVSNDDCLVKFISFVDSIIVYSRDSVGFKLKCGLTLKEALCTDTRS